MSRFLVWDEMNRKIFVVDDEQQIAILLSEVLRTADFDVETFFDARSALLRATDGQPNILITDVTMPDMDGITLAVAIRGQIPNCKIILISGNPEWKINANSQPNGMSNVALLLKPFSITQLMRLVKSEFE
ncbi:MAG: response regulator [Candidatus Korobacteraceae bacterium]